MISDTLEIWRWDANALIRRTPFLRLVEHFCTRTTGASSTSDVDFGLGGLLALLAVPGAFSSILLMEKYSSLLQWLRGQMHFNAYLSCLPDEYFFIIYSMSITGLITLLRWDQLLPDARDFSNLGTLSIPLHRIFMANVMALAMLAGLFAIDINLVSAVVFPLMVTLQATSLGIILEVGLAHAAATIGISAFTFLAFIALQGLLMAVFPERLYRRVVLLLRTVLLVLLSGTVISVFIFPLPFLQVNYGSAHAGIWWPPVWFLSLFESLIGPLRDHAPLGSGPAVQALVAVAVLTVVGFALSYQRYFLKIPERQTELCVSAARGRFSLRIKASWLRLISRPGFETACFRFFVRTLVRSETHLLFAGLWAGIGLLLTVQQLRPLAVQRLLSAPLTFTLFSLSGIRFVFDLSSAPNANWVFRLIAGDGTKAVRAACRKLLLLVGLLPLLALWFPIAVNYAGWPLAAVYLGFHALYVALLTEALLWRLQKIPFTCLLVPSRDRFLKAALGLLLVLLLLLPLLSRMEAAAVMYPLRMPAFIGSMLALLVWLYRSGEAESPALLYKDAAEESFVLLRLGNE
jgi:hypothetical protein